MGSTTQGATHQLKLKTATRVLARSKSATGDLEIVRAWAPFAVIRSITQMGERYKAYDLRTGRHLRDESRDKEQWSGLRALSKSTCDPEDCGLSQR